MAVDSCIKFLNQFPAPNGLGKYALHAGIQAILRILFNNMGG